MTQVTKSRMKHKHIYSTCLRIIRQILSSNDESHVVFNFFCESRRPHRVKLFIYKLASYYHNITVISIIVISIRFKKITEPRPSAFMLHYIIVYTSTFFSSWGAWPIGSVLVYKRKVLGSITGSGEIFQ